MTTSIFPVTEDKVKERAGRLVLAIAKDGIALGRERVRVRADLGGHLPDDIAAELSLRSDHAMEARFLAEQVWCQQQFGERADEAYELICDRYAEGARLFIRMVEEQSGARKEGQQHV